MDKYEYSELCFTTRTCVDSGLKLKAELNRLGNEGWLLVSNVTCSSNDNGTDTYVALIARRTQAG